MSAHCDACGYDLAYDLSCRYCEVVAERDLYRTALEIAGGSIEFEGNVAGAMDIICAALAGPAA